MAHGRLMAHPSFVMTLISLRSTLVATAGSMTFKIASTVIGASWCEYCETTYTASRNTNTSLIIGNLIKQLNNNDFKINTIDTAPLN